MFSNRYFTQTVQQTSCAKSKCDLLEGSCRESPRWVSLLVAEIFYPDVYFPVNQSPEDGFITANTDQNTLAALAAEIAKQQQPDLQHVFQQQAAQQTQTGQQQSQSVSGQHFHVMNSNHHNLNKHTRLQQVKQSGQPVGQRHQVNTAHLQAHELMLANMLKRQDKMPLNGAGNNINNAANLNNNNNIVHGTHLHRHRRYTSSEAGTLASSTSQATDHASSPDKATQSQDSSGDASKKQCDGYDKIGCYNIRVYYDWFLVNGSCKCYRTSSSGLNGINETIKRIFIGKWK